ncbi:Protein FMP52, mitochondrial [Cytospora mali]|uniref:Protein FMP52, mitochondrial n=1 Tax=Cytospora mali TaxID=578113 RepID=A0A194UWJ7_CYTMA|nr:Protein FMP52, mitochondrial [Valsa mali var. pyri (nom. inval.)]
MKVVITGATGFIGREVLEQCIEHPSITSIIVLSRRELPGPATSPKVKVVVIDDFLKYSPSTLSEIQDADACIWALGKTLILNNDDARRISIDYTLAAAQAFTENAAAKGDRESKFRFIYVSGRAAERDQTKSLWFLRDYRRIRGQVETEVIEHAKKNPGAFEAYVMRPGLVLKKEFNLADVGRSFITSVRVDALAKVTIDVALNGFEREIWENGDIVERGKTM